MYVVTQLYFQIVEEINYMFRPFSGWAIIRLRLEYRRKLIYYNVDIKNGETRSRSPILDVHVVDFFNNVKIQLRYDGHLYT
jgi:hypothetical protein